MIKNRLKKLREDRKLLQKDIASMLNITASAYGYYENGKREPSNETLEFLAKFYDVSVDYLLGIVDNPSNTLDNTDELIIWIGQLLNPKNNEIFKQKFIKMLSKLDEYDWISIEKMFYLLNKD